METNDSHSQGQQPDPESEIDTNYDQCRPDKGMGHNGTIIREPYSGHRQFRQAPVLVGEEFDVTIESMSKRGDAGVARVEGLVIFIEGTNVGDKVRIRISKVGRGYASAAVIETSSNALPEDGLPTRAN
ncbi:MAG: TRAM domain-containing protein [Nitrososphaeraceae archaeon]